MTRNDFFTTCASGICSCAGFALLAEAPAQAQSSNRETDELKGRLDFVNKRFATFINILKEELDEPTRKRIIRRLGAECSKDYAALFDKYKGDLKGFLDAIQKQWVEKAEYDDKAGTIRILDKSKACVCAFVKQGVTPREFCDCSLGWLNAAFSAVSARPVEVELEASHLRGDGHCAFRIRIP